MSADPNKKSGRTFQCRDVLWETFEQMARELECSIDYLVNESMKQYARQRSYNPRTPFPGGARVDGAPHPAGPLGTGQGPATSVPPPPMANPLASAASVQGSPPSGINPAGSSHGGYAGGPPPPPLHAVNGGPPPIMSGQPGPPPMMGGQPGGPAPYGAPPPPLGYGGT